MTDSKIKIKILREDTIIITKSMLAKISTPSDVKKPTMDIEGKRYFVTSWKDTSGFCWNKLSQNSKPDYVVTLVAANEWELT